MIYCFSLDSFVLYLFSRQTVILISYSFLFFTLWLVNINNSVAAAFNILATSKFFGIMDDVVCAIFLALITIVAEIVIGKSVMHMW